MNAVILAHRSTKIDQIREFLGCRIRRFPHLYEHPLYDEMNRCLALCSPEFLHQRGAAHLTRIISAQYAIRKNLFQALDNTLSRFVDVRFIPGVLSFPFSSKPVLGIMIGLHLQDHYELFTEEHAMRAIRRLDANATLVQGTSLQDYSSQAKIKIIYLELEKPIRGLLQRTKIHDFIRQSIEKVRPSVFMQQNEEDVLKNILTLSQEISSPSDLPQAIIHFEDQSADIVIFKVILLFVARDEGLDFAKLFHKLSHAMLRLDRLIPVRYLAKKYPVQAAVFHLHIPKTADMIRPDASLNFHLARQRISSLLKDVLGEYRDYNGGLISQQQETLSLMKERFSSHTNELIENFFYSISPLENQATISLSTATALFELVIQSLQESFNNRSDYFLRWTQNETQTFAVFRAGENAFQQFLSSALESHGISKEHLTTTAFFTHDSFIMAFILDHAQPAVHARLVQALQTAAAAWADKTERMQILRFALEFPPYSLDPRIQGDEYSKTILRMLFDGLMRIDATGQVVPGVAEKVDIRKDGKQYRFTLRTSYWSNGDLVTAFDFVYAWKMVLSPHFKTAFSYFLYPIQNAQAVKAGLLPIDSLGVKAIDDKTLVVDLAFPIPYFLELVAHPQFSPVNARIDRLCPNWPSQDNDDYICNGAFRLKKNNPPYGCRLMKNPTYWDVQHIQLDEVKIVQANEVAAFQMFQKNELDWFGFPMKIKRSFPSNPKTDKTVFLSNETILWYAFNTQDILFQHKKLRNAFSLAVQREEIVRAFPGMAWPACSPLSLRHSRTFLMEENTAKAIQLFEEVLSEMGMDRSNFPIIHVLCAKESYREKISQLMADNWATTFGIRCVVEALEGRSTLAKIFQGEFQICMMHWISVIDDPSYTLAIFSDVNESINVFKWNNEEYRALFNEGQQKNKPEERQLYFSQAEGILIRETPVVPVLRIIEGSIQKNSMSMQNHSSLKGWDFKWASINKKRGNYELSL